MTKPEIIGLAGMFLLLLLTIPFYFQAPSSVASSAAVDTNKVAVSAADTTPGFLFPKLFAGSNITLSILNPGANELVQISAASGTGKTYTSGTPATIQVNNDLNTISQNFDGNLWLRVAPLFPVPDSNLLDLSWVKLTNYPTGCGAFLAVQTIGDTLGCISVPSEANIDGNAFAAINSLDLNNSLNYLKIDSNKVKVSENDTNAEYLFTKLQAGNGISLSVQNPGADENILITASGSITDTNCSNNINCILTSKFDINGPSLTLTKDPNFGSLKYGDENKGIGFPLGKDFCVFGLTGFPCSGVLFNQTTIPSVQGVLFNDPSFITVISATQTNGLLWTKPNSALPNTTLIFPRMQYSSYATATYLDGNFPVFHYRDINNWAGVGTRQSAFDQPFLFQGGDFNNLNRTIRFFGHVDMNQTLDVNGNANFLLDLNVGNNLDVNGQAHFDKNVQIDQNLNVDGNISTLNGCVKISVLAFCPNTIDSNGGVIIYDWT